MKCPGARRPVRTVHAADLTSWTISSSMNVRPPAIAEAYVLNVFRVALLEVLDLAGPRYFWCVRMYQLVPGWS